MRRSSAIQGFTILFLAVLAIVIWLGVAAEDRGGKLTVSFLDIGQGDAIFIDAPSGRQVLIDGGSGRSVLRQLGKTMPWYDRSIDIIVCTHPDADHIGGLIDVLDRYKVGMIVESSVLGETPLWETFEKRVADESKSGAKLVKAQRGQVIDLGEGAYLEVLSPDRAVPHVETNVGCVVTKLIYGDTAFMLPCDAPAAIEKYLVALDGSTLLTTGSISLHANVLKAGHHGSKTSSNFSFVGFVDPEYAIYSRGCDNSYGHPHQQTIDTFAKFNIPTLDTCERGTITFVSDGKTVSLNK